MTECRAVVARAAPEASARIGAVREAHLAMLRPMAADGRILLAVPLMDGAGAYGGSLILVAPEALDHYLSAEPFRTGGVWESHAVHPFRIAPLPWRPFPDGPTPAAPTHTITIAWDGRDAGALERRLAHRQAHFERVRVHAESGLLALGGALLDGEGRMAGSIAVTAHPSIEEAKAWWADDPYVAGGVWQDIAWHVTRFAPLPYRPLPTP
ncbi:YciI family protein [Muricoccus radiodurans]|uniref:YciI family protein n=1 Tax=Muricoccus radiodurans TaxID=2231721 RepID=UPI003CE731EA